MKTERQHNPELQKIADLVEDIDIAMLTSQDGDHLMSRPMAALQMDEDGSLWFFTQAHSGKVAQVAVDSPQVNVAFSDEDDASYVSVSGRAEVSRDRAKIDELWTPMAKPWFKDKDDPELALLKVTTERADYWDSSSSKMVRLFEMARAAVTGTSYGEGDHGTVRNKAA